MIISTYIISIEYSIIRIIATITIIIMIINIITMIIILYGILLLLLYHYYYYYIILLYYYSILLVLLLLLYYSILAEIQASISNKTRRHTNKQHWQTSSQTRQPTKAHRQYRTTETKTNQNTGPNQAIHPRQADNTER